VARGKTVDLTRRVVKVAEWGVKYAYGQINYCLQNIEQEANISAIISLKNKNIDPKEHIDRWAKSILKSTSDNQITLRQTQLQNIIESVYPEVKYQGRELKDYEPYNRMIALAKLIGGYKKISLNAYDKSQNILNILTFRSYVMATLPEDDIHQRAASLLREYLQISQPFNTAKQ